MSDLGLPVGRSLPGGSRTTTVGSSRSWSWTGPRRQTGVTAVAAPSFKAASPVFQGEATPAAVAAATQALRENLNTQTKQWLAAQKPGLGQVDPTAVTPTLDATAAPVAAAPATAAPAATTTSPSPATEHPRPNLLHYVLAWAKDASLCEAAVTGAVLGSVVFIASRVVCTSRA